jgi:hypothetical protein
MREYGELGYFNNSCHEFIHPLQKINLIMPCKQKKPGFLMVNPGFLCII